MMVFKDPYFFNILSTSDPSPIDLPTDGHIHVRNEFLRRAYPALLLSPTLGLQGSSCVY